MLNILQYRRRDYRDGNDFDNLLRRPTAIPPGCHATFILLRRADEPASPLIQHRLPGVYRQDSECIISRSWWQRQGDRSGGVAALAESGWAGGAEPFHSVAERCGYRAIGARVLEQAPRAGHGAPDWPTSPCPSTSIQQFHRFNW
jgi:hypothetical protein